MFFISKKSAKTAGSVRRFFALFGGQKQLFCIGMLGIAEQFFHIVLLHNDAVLHDQDPVADLIDHVQVMADEEIGKVIFLLHIRQKMEDLGLNGNIQGAYRLIGNDQSGASDDGGGDGNPLALAAGELIGQPFRVFWPQPHLGKDVIYGSFAVAFRQLCLDFQGLFQNPAHGFHRV